jgi:hypothetical protein
MDTAADLNCTIKRANDMATDLANNLAAISASDETAIVYRLLKAIREHDLESFKIAAADSEAIGQHVFESSFTFTCDDGYQLDIELSEMAFRAGAKDIASWILRCGWKAQDEMSISDILEMFHMLESGDCGIYKPADLERTCQIVFRPDSVDHALKQWAMTFDAGQLASMPKVALTLIRQSSTDYLVEMGRNPLAAI